MGDSDDDLFDDDPGEKSLVEGTPSLFAKKPEAEGPPAMYGNIWECPHIIKYTTQSGGKEWQCDLCDYIGRGGHNATKVMAHLNKISGHSVALCKATIPLTYRFTYRNMWQHYKNGKDSREMNKELFNDSIVQNEAGTLTTLEEAKLPARRGDEFLMLPSVGFPAPLHSPRRSKCASSMIAAVMILLLMEATKRRAECLQLWIVDTEGSVSKDWRRRRRKHCSCGCRAVC